MAKAKDQHTPIDELSIADLDRILRLDIGLRDADALCEAQEKFERERLFLHWRNPNTGQEGNIPGIVWRNGSLKMARDPAPNAVDFATQEIRIPCDEAFVQEMTSSVPRGKQELTVSMREVHAIWQEKKTETVSMSDVCAIRPTVPRKKKTETLRDRLKRLMKEIDLKLGLLPHEVREVVEPQYRKKHHDAPPSAMTITRAYNDYTDELTKLTKLTKRTIW